MLEQLRQQSRSFIIWILFGIIILVFIISFGPQANAELGCGASDAAVMDVDGREVDNQAWRYAINGLPRLLPNFVRGMQRQQRANLAMDLLLSRELLAQAAEDAGFRVSTDTVNEKLKQGEWFFLGYPADRSWFFIDGVFNYDALERHAQNLGLQSVAAFIDQQRKEILADNMRSLIIGGVNVSRDEVLAAYNHEHYTATIDAVRFRTSSYKLLDLSREQIDAYLAENQAEVKARYDAEAVNYKDTKPALQLRQIFIQADAAPAAGKDDDGDDDGASEPAATPNKDRAVAILAELEGGADFAAVAKEKSDDKVSGARGGMLGWRRIDRPGLPDPKLTEAIATLEPGAMTALIETERGYYILKADAKREGDLSFDQVKYELAEEMAVDYYAEKAARADAEAALAQLKAGASMADLFDRAPARFDPEMLRQQLGLPPGTDMDKVLEQYRKAIEAGGKTGSVEIVGPAIPAEWQDPAADQPPPPAKPAVKVTPKATAKPTVKVTPKATKADRIGPGGKGSGKAAGAGDDDEASKFTSPDDGLPRPKTLQPPQLENIGPFNRDPDQLGRLGSSKEAVDMVFDELEIGEIAPKVFEIGDAFVIMELVSRREPDLDDFTKRESELIEEARLEKANDVFGEWMKKRCDEVVENGDVSVDKSYLTFQDDQGRDMPVTYQPCQQF